MLLILLPSYTSPALLIWELLELGLPESANKNSGCPVKFEFQVHNKFFIVTRSQMLLFGNSNNEKDLY